MYLVVYYILCYFVFLVFFLKEGGRKTPHSKVPVDGCVRVKTSLQYLQNGGRTHCPNLKQNGG